MRKYEMTERGKIIISVLLVLLLLVIPAAIFAIRSAVAKDNPPPDGNVAESPPAVSQTQEPPDTETPTQIETPTESQPTPDTEAPTQTETHTESEPAPESQTPAQTETPTESQTPPESQTPTQTETPTESQPPPESQAPQESENPPALTEPPEYTELYEPNTPSEPAPAETHNSTNNSAVKDGSTLSFVFRPDIQRFFDRNTANRLDYFLAGMTTPDDYVLIVETGLIAQQDGAVIMDALSRVLETRGLSNLKVDHLALPPDANSGVVRVTLYFVSRYVK